MATILSGKLRRTVRNPQEQNRRLRQTWLSRISSCTGYSRLPISARWTHRTRWACRPGASSGTAASSATWLSLDASRSCDTTLARCSSSTTRSCFWRKRFISHFVVDRSMDKSLITSECCSRERTASMTPWIPVAPVGPRTPVPPVGPEGPWSPGNPLKPKLCWIRMQIKLQKGVRKLVC